MGSIQTQLITLLVRLSAVTILFLAVHAILNRSLEFWYLPWNLGLAWLPVIFSSLLVSKKRLEQLRILLWGLWLVFLPNAFYVITDMIHINDQTRLNQTFDVVLLTLIMGTSFLLGLVSLWQIDQRYWQKLKSERRAGCLVAIAALCGGAVYIGRELRWNSWDIVVHPLKLIKDLSEVLTTLPMLTALAVSTISFAVCIILSYYVFVSFLALRPSASR